MLQLLQFMAQEGANGVVLITTKNGLKELTQVKTKVILMKPLSFILILKQIITVNFFPFNLLHRILNQMEITSIWSQ